MTSTPGPDSTPPLSQAWGPRLMRSVKTAALSSLRRGPGTVEFPSPNARVGNLLYLWLHAWRRQSAGEDWRVLITPATEPWIPELERVARELLVSRRDVRMTDRRMSGAYQAMGHHYSAAELEDFCRQFLVGSALDNRHAARMREAGVASSENVTINVRRGDYYAVPEYRARYGFDVTSYVDEALRAQSARAPFSRVHLVSDDLDWCREHLDLEGREVSCFDDRDPAMDLATLMASRRLVLTNSTFSYWGGYVAQSRFDDAHVVAPVFHARDWLGGRSFHLHPMWEALPGYGEQQPGG